MAGAIAAQADNLAQWSAQARRVTPADLR